jgi:hypothetical protein
MFFTMVFILGRTSRLDVVKPYSDKGNKENKPVSECIFKFVLKISSENLLELEEIVTTIPSPPPSQETEVEPSSTHVSPSSTPAPTSGVTTPTPVNDPDSSGHSTVSFSNSCAFFNY